MREFFVRIFSFSFCATLLMLALLKSEARGQNLLASKGYLIVGGGICIAIFLMMVVVFLFPFLRRKDPFIFKGYFEIPMNLSVAETHDALMSLGYGPVRIDSSESFFTKEVNFIEGIGISINRRFNIDVFLVGSAQGKVLRFSCRELHGEFDGRQLAYKAAQEYTALKA